MAGPADIADAEQSGLDGTYTYEADDGLLVQARGGSAHRS